ncbi:hypothetical protein CHS0354_038870 [Potamilus streckersoni]|uniref:Uncharacterized protein n=1 Tax=Potamilus streckersoni TaxID=2493646 RepID=A0AAE0SC67_9BIVA|nr:hypothetical protein CHS0354_038870 [Potamilus streckersoni]
MFSAELLPWALLFSTELLGVGAIPFLADEPPKIGTPDCYSANALCDVAFNSTSLSLHLSSSQPICICPGNEVCPRGWGDNIQSIYKVIQMQGDEVIMKMSYCSPITEHEQICGKFDPVLILKGSGPFSFEMATDLNCTCSGRPLYLNRSWSKGVINYMEYSCGKPRCNANRSSGDTCMWVERMHEPDSHVQYRYEHKYPCRCHPRQVCRVPDGKLPTKPMESVPGYCENN